MQKLLGKIWNKSEQQEQQEKKKNKGIVGNNNEIVKEIEVNGQKVKIPKEHANASVEEQENCPFMKMQKQKEQDSQIVDTEAVMPFQKKEKKPKGGCPFMPSENKKNPPLQLDLELKYDMKYISPKNYLISNKGFNLFKKNQKERKIFDSYPVYLKHSMFHQEDALMVKARKCEISQKFFIFDQFREKGNKFLKKNDLEMALNCYEHALSVVRWIELLDEDDIEYEKELKQKQIENVKKREEEEKQKKLEKKTKRGAKLQSINSKQRQKQRDQELKEEIEEMAEESDYEEIEPVESEEEKKKRIEEQEERQRLLYEKARQQILKSSLPNSNQNSNNSNEETNEESKSNKDNLSECDSLDRGIRSDEDFDISEEEDEELEQNQDQQKKEQIENQNQEESKEEIQEQLRQEEKKQKMQQKRKEQKEKEENLRKKSYLKEKIEDEDYDTRSDIAIGDQQDLLERKAELDREQRDEQRKEEKLKELIKEYELEEDEQEQQQEEIQEEIQKESARIRMEEKQISQEEIEKQKQQRERKAKEMLEMEEEDKEFRKKYKLFLSNFNDENTRLFDGEDLKDAHDIDMRQGMLLTILMSIAIVYLKLGHYSNAIEALEDSDKVAQMKSSQIYFRKAQAVCYNKSASLQMLQKGKEDIILALKIKSTEKMFKQEKGILKILNLSDHEEAYQSLAIEITDRIHRKKEEETEKIRNLLERAAEIEEIYQEMVEDGRKQAGEEDEEEEDIRWSLDKEGRKFEGNELKIFLKIRELEENKEKEITRIIVDKHYSMVDFYVEQMKIEKVRGAQEELQKALAVQNEMNFYYELDLQEKSQNQIVLEVNKEFKVELGLERVQKRLNKLKMEYARDIYEQGNFNFYILEYAIKEYFKRLYNLKNRLEQMQDDRLKKKKNSRNNNNSQDNKPGFGSPLSLSNLFSAGGVFQIAFLLFLVVLVLSFFNSDLAKNMNIEQIFKIGFPGFSFK